MNNLNKITILTLILSTFVFISCTTPKKYTKTGKSLDSINKRDDLDCQKENIARALALHKEAVKLSKDGETAKAEIKDLAANELLKEIEKGCPDEEKKEIIEDDKPDEFSPETKEITSAGNEDLKITVVSDYTPEMINFDFNSYKIKNEAKEILLKHIEYLSEKSGIVIQLEGHTDSSGSEEYNLNLGNKRAEIVKTFFKNQGISLEIKTTSYGEELLLNNDSTENDHYQNRRVEFKFLLK